MDAVVKEVMRLFGIVDGIWRQSLEDITIQGHQIPKVRARGQPNAVCKLRLGDAVALASCPSWANKLKEPFRVMWDHASSKSAMDLYASHEQSLRNAQGWTVQLMVKRSGLAAEEFQEDAYFFKPSRWLESDGQPLRTNPKGFMPFGGVSGGRHTFLLASATVAAHSLPLTCMASHHSPVSASKPYFTESSSCRCGLL